VKIFTYYYNYLIFLKIIPLLVWPLFCYSADTQRNISLISENDIYAPKAQDRHYTNGLRLSLGNSNLSWESLEPLLNTSSSTTYRDEIAIGHSIYTPENYISPELQESDRPFAGWMYGEYTAIANTQITETAIGLSIGLVGSAALGRQIQTLNHSIINDPKPLGWDNQLNNEPAILLKYRQSQFHPIAELGNTNLGLITRLGLNLGNVFTDAGAGMVLRLGSYLSNHELPIRIQPGISGNSTYIEVRNNRFDWQIFTEIQGRGVIHNIFLDGNTFNNSHSVRKKPFVWESSAGLVLSSGHFKHPLYLAFTLTWRSLEFELQNGNNNFGSALIGLQY